MKLRCKSKTKEGMSCSREAGESGYCHVHDPVRLEARRKAAVDTRTRAKPLNEVIEVLTATCEARGWASEVVSIDNKDYRHAALKVSRYVDTGSQQVQITGFVRSRSMEG